MFWVQLTQWGNIVYSTCILLQQWWNVIKQFTVGMQWVQDIQAYQRLTCSRDYFPWGARQFCPFTWMLFWGAGQNRPSWWSLYGGAPLRWTFWRTILSQGLWNIRKMSFKIKSSLFTLSTDKCIMLHCKPRRINSKYLMELITSVICQGISSSSSSRVLSVWSW